MTGTLRDYRGRGLALLAKRATLVNAAGRGVELVSTENDEPNGPMFMVNEKLGYRPVGRRSRRSRMPRANELRRGRSVKGEQRREDDHDRGGPQGEDGKVGGLPALEPVEPCCVR